MAEAPGNEFQCGPKPIVNSMKPRCGEPPSGA